MHIYIAWIICKRNLVALVIESVYPRLIMTAVCKCTVCKMTAYEACMVADVQVWGLCRSTCCGLRVCSVRGCSPPRQPGSVLASLWWEVTAWA